uniref:Uncharacterized protein n=1 Tax=Arundo donax TaxID=35708 RepID=A0A0A9H636_ARUDO
MDGRGEALLVRRSKSKKRPLPAAAPAERDPGGGGDRFRALWRDYHDLLEETEAKKKRLASANWRKLGLLAEVKFLRRKYKCFAKGDSQQTQYQLKGQARQIPSPAGSNEASAFADHGAGTEVPSTSRNPNLDLNQNTVMNDERNDYQGHQGHTDKFDLVGVDEDMMATDAKLSVCRDTGNSPVSDDKRSIPWQDGLALKA